MIIIKVILLEHKNYSFCLSFFSRSWKKFWYLYLKMPHPKTPYHIDFLASMDSLWIITLYTQIHQFCDNRSQTFWGYISMKNFFKKCLTCSKIPRISPLPLFNVVSSLKKLCQAVVGRNDQGNFQKTLNEGDKGCKFHYFLTACRLIRTCRTQWWCFLLLFLTGNTLSEQIWFKKPKLSI